MTTRAELEEQIMELKAAQATAERLNQVSHDLNAAASEEEVLQALIRPMAEFGVNGVDLVYIDLDQAGEPEWGELVAAWRTEGSPPFPIGSRLYIPEFPFNRLWMANPDEPQLISDVLTDERIDENTKNLLTQIGSQATATVPLIQAGRWVGLIFLLWRKAHTFSPQESKILHTLGRLVSPIVENRWLLKQAQESLGELRRLTMAVEQFIDGIAMSDMDGNIFFTNSAWAEMHGYSREELLGQHLSIFHTEEQLQEDVNPFNELVMEFGAYQTHVGHLRQDGSTFPTWMSSSVLKDEAGNPVGLMGMARDITEQQEVEAERERLQQEIIEAQQRTLQELSTPIIPVMERILVMPLVGSIDSLRAKDIMRELLAGIRAHSAQVVILDITGVPIVDSGVANYLNKTIRAARLKGARTIVTGISEDVAEAIVDLGIDWSGITTLSNLQTGLVAALESLGIKLSKT